MKFQPIAYVLAGISGFLIGAASMVALYFWW